MNKTIYVTALVVATSAWTSAAFAAPVQENYPGAPFAVKDNGVAQGSPTGKYGASQEFNVGAKTFVIETDPVKPQDRSAPATKTDVAFDTVLAAAFPKWDFAYTGGGGADLALANNTLVVKTYDVKNVAPVAMDFYVAYTGAAPAVGVDLHWIQVIKTNWKLGAVLYTDDNKVDNLGAVNPFYDTLAKASGSLGDPDKAYFWDTPSRDKAGLAAYNGTPVYWWAEVYLVELTKADNGKGGSSVNIYDGVRWGWKITEVKRVPGGVPEPATWAMLIVGFGATGCALRRTRRTRVAFA